MAIDIKVLSTTAMKTVFEELSPAFERATGNRLAVTLGPSLRLEKQLGEGEAADMAIVSASGAQRSDRTRQDGRGQRRRDREVVHRRRGAERGAEAGPVLGRGLQAGVARGKIDCLLEAGRRRPKRRSHRQGVRRPRHRRADAAKAKYGAGGAGGLAGLVVLRGEADIGIQQMAELMAVEGIDVVGPLPAEIQMVTPFVAAIPANASHAEAGRAVIAFLTTPEAKRVLKAKGLEPA